MNRRSFFSFLASVPFGIASIAAAKPDTATVLITRRGPPLPLDTPLPLASYRWVGVGDFQSWKFAHLLENGMFGNMPGRLIKPPKGV